jgi:hypothetical protein
MKTLSVFVIFVLLLLLFVIPALAQEPTAEPGPPVYVPPTELPSTAAGGLEVVQTFILFVGGLITYYAVNAIKKLPGLSSENIEKISGLTAEALTAITACIVGLALAYGAMLAGFLDQNGFWSVIQWVWATWPVAFAIHKGNKLSAVAAK